MKRLSRAAGGKLPKPNTPRKFMIGGILRKANPDVLAKRIGIIGKSIGPLRNGKIKLARLNKIV